MVEETSEVDLSSKQLAKAAGMSTRRLDKLLINAKESQKKIIQCYRGLVVSVAASYQGKGLSLQDLIQVPNFISCNLAISPSRFCFPLDGKHPLWHCSDYRKEA